MFKYLKNLFLIIALSVSCVFAFTNGNALGTPWVAPLSGDLYVSFNSTVSGTTYSFQNLNEASVNVTTVKIYQVNVSTNYVPIGSQVTLSYVIENTGVNNISVTATGLNFFYLTTGNVQNSYFTVTRLSPAAGSFALAAGATRNIVFRALVNSGRPTGRFIVDGRVTANLSTNFTDKYWSSSSIRSSFVFTGAITPNYLYEATSTLNIPAVAISSPNGAVDRVLSAGQNFWVSCNVQNLGESAIGGSRVIQIQWPAGIVAAPTVTTKSFTIGQPVTFNLTALPASYGTGIVTVSIMNTPAVHPIDLLTGVTVNYLQRIATMSITVQRPARLDILDVYVPTSQVESYQPGPFTVQVRVRNVGSANAMINAGNSDLQFLVAGFDMSSTYVMNAVPSVSVYLGSLQTTTVNYIIGTFGGGTGICTVNVTLNATDLNSGIITRNRATLAEVATYNVTANGGVSVGQVRVNKDPIGYRGSFEVYVPLNRIASGANAFTVRPNIADLFIAKNSAPLVNLAGISFNITAVSPAIPFTIAASDLTTKVITYSVTVLASAVSGDYTINVLPSRPRVSENVTGKDVSDPNGGVPTTTVTYDPISPNLTTITANFTGYPVFVTRPQTNFRVNMFFSETMNVSYVPQMSFVMQSGSAPSYATGAWAGNRRYFTSAVMTLVTANQGYVTGSMTGGARDLAGNTVVPSANCLRFFVDATAPVGSIVINGGEAVTANPLATARFTLSDNYSATANMMMYIYGLPTSNVSSNPGIVPVNTWVTYNQQITLNLQTTMFGTKNIAIRFRDQAGNLSAVYSDSIYLDTNTIIWLNPTNNAIVSNNFYLQAQTSIYADYVNYYVSVNNTLTRIRRNLSVNPSTGIASYLWTTANIYPGTTTNAWLIASMKKGTIYATANITNITFDNTLPLVTINTPVEGSYVYGQTPLVGVASDPANTSVQRVEISINGGAYNLATGTTAWTYNFAVPTADPNFTVYQVRARVTDQAGNQRVSTVRNLIKLYDIPVITAYPTANTYMKNTFTISGNVSSLLPISRVEIREPTLLTITRNAVGTANWLVTFNATPAFLISGTTHTFTVRAYTATTPSIVSVLSLPYRIDVTRPVLSVTNLTSLVNGIAGTLNITGEYVDAHSGISNVQMRIDGGVWQNINVTNNTTFNYVLAVTKPAGAAYAIDLRAYDRTYITPNVSVTSSYLLTVNYGVLPSATFNYPVSGSYVNNVVTINGTAAMPFTTVQTVYLSFNNGSTWVTANGATNWNYRWTVPPADPHGQIYQPIISVRGANGIWARPSPDATTRYIKDIYGPAVVITNLTNGMYVVFDPFFATLATHTDGAVVSAAYMVIQGTSYTVTMTATISNNMKWSFSRDFPTLPAGTYTVYARAIDTAGNWGQSTPINVRNTSGRLITEPLPPNGIIDGATTSTNPAYATSVNYVLFSNILPANVSAVYVNGFGPQPYSAFGGNLRVSINTIEQLYVITIFETNAGITIAHYQSVVYDVTRPTINVVFSGVTRYYPDGIVAPDELFRVNIIDRTASGLNYGSGFSATPTMSYITGNSLYYRAGSIQRSVFQNLTTINTVIGASAFDPYGEVLTFQSNLTAGNRYDLAVYAVDNAGNAVITTFNVYGLIVNDGATGDSGEIDDSQLIISYPNPYDPGSDGNEVKFTYYLTDNVRKARVFIYNEVGELISVQTVNTPATNGTQAGYNEIGWDARDKFDKELSNGVYLYVIVVEGSKKQSSAKGKMVILRR